MIGKVERGIEEGMDRIADNLVHHAAVLDDDPRHGVDIAIEEEDHRFRSRPFSELSEAFDIGEERGDDPGLAGKLDLAWIGGDAAHHFGRKMERESALDRESLPVGCAELRKTRTLDSEKRDDDGGHGVGEP